MNSLTKILVKSAVVLAAGMLLPAASTTVLAQTAPQIISNTAMAEWNVGGQTLSRPSNTVQFTVQSAPVTPPVLSLFRFSKGPGSAPVQLPPTMCAGTNGPVPMTFGGVYSGLETNPASILPTTAIRAGEPLIIRVDYAAKNANPGAIDSFEVVITTPNGDRERVTLTESAVNSGRFTGFINTKAAPPPPIVGDCALSVQPGDTVDVEIDDVATGSGVGNAPVEILVDPFGVSFDSGDGAPVDGTSVTIVDAATGQPATVFGDDGVSAFPSTLITGSYVNDSNRRI